VHWWFSNELRAAKRKKWCVAYDEFKEIDIKTNAKQVVYDIKAVLINADATL